MHFYPPMLTDDHRRTRTERDKGGVMIAFDCQRVFCLLTCNLSINFRSVFTLRFLKSSLTVLYNKSVNEWSPGKQLTLRFSGNKINSVFHPRPVIKCLKELRHGLCILKNLA